MQEVLDTVFKPLLKFNYGDTPSTYYVAISHTELDWLIASLMHLAELDSDKEHREALKGEIKVRTRAWLDDRYQTAGYINHSVVPRANVIDLGDLHEPKFKPAEPTN